MKGEQLLRQLPAMQEDIARMTRLQTWYRNQLAGLDRDGESRGDSLREASRKLADDISRALREYESLAAGLGRLTARLPDKDEREALKLYYFSLLRCEEAAGVMGFSPRQFYRIKLRALQHLEGLMKEKR